MEHDEEKPPDDTAAPEPPPESPPDPAPHSPDPPRDGPLARLFSPRSPLFAASLVAVAGLLCAFGLTVTAHRSLPLPAPAPRPTASAGPRDAGVDASDASLDATPTDASVDAADAADAAARKPSWHVSSLASDTSLELVEGTVGKRAFLVALAAAGVGKAEGPRILKAFEGVRSFEKCGARDSFVIVRDRAKKRVVAFEYATSALDVWQAREQGEHELVGKKLELSVERTRVAVAITVGDDLRESVMRAGLDDDLVKMLDEALHGHVDRSALRAGARLRVVAQEARANGEFAAYESLDAVELVPTGGRGTLRVYAFAHGGKGKVGYYDAKARQPFHGGWHAPIPFARISSRFNPRRMHPVLHVVMPHNGVDYAGHTGTPVYSTAAGVVRTAGDGGPCGNMVQVQHANGLVSAYCHLSRFAAGLHAGQHVEARQLVGYVGQTGRVTGPHLHFAVKRGDVFIDPLGLKLDGFRVLASADRDEFGKRRSELDAALDAIALPTVEAKDAGAPAEDGGEPEVIFEEPP